MAKGLGGSPLDRRLGITFTLWPTLLAPVAPPKEFALDVVMPSTPGVPLSMYGVPLVAATAYRTGDAARAVKLLEPRLRAEEATAAECFFLAMAAKNAGDAGLAARALDKGVNTSSAPVRPPVGVGGIPAFGFAPVGFGGGGFGIATEAWRQRVVNEVLRREAEEVVRGPKP